MLVYQRVILEIMEMYGANPTEMAMCPIKLTVMLLG